MRSAAAEARFTVGVECLDAFAEIIRAAQAAIGLAFELDGERQGPRRSQVQLRRGNPGEFVSKAQCREMSSTGDASWIMLNEVMPSGRTPHRSPSR